MSYTTAIQLDLPLKQLSLDDTNDDLNDHSSKHQQHVLLVKQLVPNNNAIKKKRLSKKDKVNVLRLKLLNYSRSECDASELRSFTELPSLYEVYVKSEQNHFQSRIPIKKKKTSGLFTTCSYTP